MAFVVSPASARYRPPDSTALRGWGPGLRYVPTGSTSHEDARQALEQAEAVWIACAGQMWLDGRLERWADA